MLIIACQQNPARPVEKQSVVDVIPITAANLRGHQQLYDEGWFVVTSSKKALDYAREHSIQSSALALQTMGRNLNQDTLQYSQKIARSHEHIRSAGEATMQQGSQRSLTIMKNTQDLIALEAEATEFFAAAAWEQFVKGHLSLRKRTANDFQELQQLPGNYFKNMSQDMSRFYQNTDAFIQAVKPDVEVGWQQSFDKAYEAFAQDYQRSATENNAIAGLGHILAGYGKVFYHSLIAPIGRMTKKGAAETGDIGLRALAVPVGAALSVSGRTIESLGLSIYYSSRIGVKIISPTVESGLLAGLSIVSASTMPVTFVAGHGYGLVNQVAMHTVVPAATLTTDAVVQTANTVNYAATMAYDMVKGTSEVVIHQASSGVVLGYNALTALPSHAVLGGLNTVFFLAWDGPRLVVAAARGDLSFNSGEKQSIADIPVGSVVDLQQLNQQSDVEVEVISTDPKVINDVLQEMQNDLRVP